MSSWGKKLDKKLATLTDNASKETIQTVANWIVFNRKHASTIASTLTQNLQEQAKIENARRVWLYWQLIHEILVAERETPAKWEKSIDLRVALGEALIPAMELLGSSMASSSNTTEMSDYLKEWESLNVFGGPSLMSQIKRLYANRNSISAADEAPQQQTASTLASVKQEELESASAPVAEAPESAESTASKTKTTDTVKTKLEETPAKRRSSFSQNNKIVDYDFDAKGVEQGKVEAKEFLEPCKAIATLQIARDVRANTAVEVSTSIANLPEDIVETCNDLQSGKMSELDAAKINDYSIRIPSNLLDLNMEEELNSVHLFQDIVQRQKKAREELIKLLLKSRCEFGSHVAAQDYYDTAAITGKLRKRKQLLSDALELEGLDASEIVGEKDEKKKEVALDQDMPTISWYKPDVSETKKQRTS